MSVLHRMLIHRLHILFEIFSLLMVDVVAVVVFFSPGNATQVQRPSIWVYDLENNAVIRRFEIPESIVERGDGLASVTVDAERQTCGDAYAYLPDLVAYRLHVYRCL